MPDSAPSSVARTYVHAWTTGDFDTTRRLLHDDVTFVGPLGTAEGIEACMKGLQGLAKVVHGSKEQKVIADGADVCVIYDLVTTSSAADVPTAGWYQVRGDKISAIRVFFDPRPLAG
jgi:ketosteroid isomerase-like protein